MSGEKYNSPNGSPENFRGLSTSDLLSLVKKTDSVRMLELVRYHVTEQMFLRDLNEDEKDLVVSIDFHMQKIRDLEKQDVALIAENVRILSEDEARTKIAFWALAGRFDDKTFDAQLGADEDERIAQFKKSMEQDS